MKLFGTHRVGVDIGTSAVRAVEVTGLDSHGYAMVSRIGIARLPDGAVVGGEIKHAVSVAKALSSALRQAGLPRHGFILGVASKYVALGRLASPDAVLPSERIQAIRMQSAEISPTIRLADSAISWNLVRSDITGENRLVHLLNVAAVKRSEVEMLNSVCRIAGAQPQAIDLTGAALMRSLVRTDPNGQDIATVVDIGATKTLIATRQGVHLRSVRTVPTGGATLTRALMGALNVTYQEAEERKLYMRLTTAPVRAAVQASGAYIDDETTSSPALETSGEEVLAKATESIIEEIAKSISADALAYDRQVTQGIYLTGGGSRLRGLADRLRTRVGVPCAVMRPWANIQQNRRTAMFAPADSENEELLTELTPAIGLALWRAPQ